jgi:hypothetical protein
MAYGIYPGRTLTAIGMALEMWDRKQRFGLWFYQKYGGPKELSILPDENVRRIVSRGLDRDSKLTAVIQRDYISFKLKK